MELGYGAKVLCTAICVATVAFFMESLGFSPNCSMAAVLLSLAALEMFTNFPSSILIRVILSFTKISNDWIQTKVSHTVETQKSHWHIKSYIPISPLDADKINSILADMRNVLAKNPQIEQEKLHRRVFLEDIDPENQALKIMISFFVKTSHFEEYLCVKEAILLDLLKVARHHRARLTNPICLVDEPVVFDSKSDENFAATSTSPPGVNSKDKSKSSSDAQIQNTDSDSSVEKTSKTMQPKKESAGDLGKTPASKNLAQSAVSETSPVTSHESGRGETASAASSQSKQDEEKSSVPSSLRPPLEENILLGVALEGSK